MQQIQNSAWMIGLDDRDVDAVSLAWALLMLSMSISDAVLSIGYATEVDGPGQC